MYYLKALCYLISLIDAILLEKNWRFMIILLKYLC